MVNSEYGARVKSQTCSTEKNKEQHVKNLKNRSDWMSDSKNSQVYVGFQDSYNQKQDELIQLNRRSDEKFQEIDRRLANINRLLENMMINESGNHDDNERDQCTNTRYFH